MANALFSQPKMRSAAAQRNSIRDNLEIEAVRKKIFMEGGILNDAARVYTYCEVWAISILSFAVWTLTGMFYGGLRHCAGLCRFFFPVYAAYRSNSGDPLQTVCLRCPKKSAVPKYHCHFFPWSRPNCMIEKTGPVRLLPNTV